MTNLFIIKILLIFQIDQKNLCRGLRRSQSQNQQGRERFGSVIQQYAEQAIELSAIAQRVQLGGIQNTLLFSFYDQVGL